MIDQVIYECQVCFPSLERAKRFVPREFLYGWDWFQENEGQIRPLPYGKNTPAGSSIPLMRQAGIYSPSQSNVLYVGRRYALSVHSNDLERYPDKEPVKLGNGTWVFDYAAQDGDLTKVAGQQYNEVLMNCLEDAVPIGVMIKERNGYRVWGLAYVERYNSMSKMFTLHGPINARTEALHLFDYAVSGGLSPNELKVVESADEEEARRVVSRIARVQQEAFRSQLLIEYDSTCAVTGSNVPEVLQAAHIEPYRGRTSQVASNGLLLRSDVHLLYDAHLLSVVPERHVVQMSDRLRGTAYEQWNGVPIRLPRRAEARPRDELLEQQYKQFLSENYVLE